MPDITMCSDATCPWRVRCVRHEASGTVPSVYQWRFTISPRRGETCAEYWPLTPAAEPTPEGTDED